VYLKVVVLYIVSPMFQRKGARICWLYSYQEWLNRFLVPLTISDVLWASFFNFNLLFPAVFPSCNFLKEFLPSYHFCYTIFISSTTCEGESLVKLPTRCDRIRLRSALPLMVLLGADSCFFFKRKAYKQIFQLKLYTFPKKMGRV
jgi:hypothetical protein